MNARDRFKEALKVIGHFAANFVAGYLFLFGMMMGFFRQEYHAFLSWHPEDTLIYLLVINR